MTHMRCFLAHVLLLSSLLRASIGGITVVRNSETINSIDITVSATAYSTNYNADCVSGVGCAPHTWSGTAATTMPQATAGTRYSFRIYSDDGGTNTDPSPTVENYAFCTKPNDPTGYTHDTASYSATSATITWDAAPTFSHKARLTTATFDTIAAGTSTKTFTPLTSATCETAELYSVFACGQIPTGSYDTESAIVTFPVCTAPQKGTATIASVTHNSMDINIGVTGGPTTDVVYDIRVYEQGTPEPGTATSANQTASPHTTVTTLAPCTQYSYRVTPVFKPAAHPTLRIEGVPSDVANQYTRPQDIAGSGTQANTDTDSLTIQGVGMGGTTFATIEAIIGSGSPSSRCEIPTPETFTSAANSADVDLTGLSQGCEYTLSLVGQCQGLDSTNPRTFKYCTQPDPPANLVQDQTACAVDSIKITWTSVTSTPAVTYKVSMNGGATKPQTSPYITANTLTASTNYTFDLYAEFTCGTPGPAETRTSVASSNEFVTAPIAPTITESATTINSIDVDIAPTTAATEWDLRYRITGSAAAWTPASPQPAAADTTDSIASLTSCTSYDFELYPIYHGCQGPAGTATIITNPDKVDVTGIALKAASVSSSGFTVEGFSTTNNWDEIVVSAKSSDPNCPATPSDTVLRSDATKEAIFSGLESGCIWELEFVAECDTGSKLSPTVHSTKTFCTNPVTPVPTQDMSTTTETAGGFTFTENTPAATKYFIENTDTTNSVQVTGTAGVRTLVARTCQDFHFYAVLTCTDAAATDYKGNVEVINLCPRPPVPTISAFTRSTDNLTFTFADLTPANTGTFEICLEAVGTTPCVNRTVTPTSDSVDSLAACTEHYYHLYAIENSIYSDSPAVTGIYTYPNQIAATTSQQDETTSAFRITGLTIVGSYEQIDGTISANGDPAADCVVAAPITVTGSPAPVSDVLFNTGLSAGCEYTVDLVAACGAGSAVGASTSVKHCTLPDPPINLVQTSCTSTSFKVGWDDPASANPDGYEAKLTTDATWTAALANEYEVTSGLTSGSSYVLSVRSVLNCANNDADTLYSTAVTITVTTVGEAALTVTVNSTGSDATVIAESDHLDSSQNFFLREFQCNCSDGCNQVAHNETGRVRIELRDLIPGSIIKILSLSVSDENGKVVDSFATESDVFCTKPLPPDFAALVAEKRFSNWYNNIQLRGDLEHVDSSSGNLEYYVFDPDNPHGDAYPSNAVPLDSLMRIEGLSRGTQYNFTFYGKIDGCNGTLSGHTTELNLLCTDPDGLRVSAASSNTTAITIKGADVSLYVGLGFADSYVIDIRSPIVRDANISQSKSIGTEDFTITDLAPGTRYKLRSRHVYGVNVECLNGPALGLDYIFYAACTAPEIEITEIDRNTSNEVPGVLKFKVSYEGNVSGVSIKPSDYEIHWNMTELNAGQLLLEIHALDSYAGGRVLKVSLCDHLCDTDCGLTDLASFDFSTMRTCTHYPTIDVFLHNANQTTVLLDFLYENGDEILYDKVELKMSSSLSNISLPPTTWYSSDKRSVDGLTPGTVYNFEAILRLGIGESAGGSDCGEGGEVTSQLQFVACTSYPVIDVFQANTNQTSMLLHFLYENGGQILYDKIELQISSSLSNNSLSPITWYSNDKRSIDGLTPGTAYNFLATLRLGIGEAAGGIDCGEGGEITSQLQFVACTTTQFEITEITRDASEEFPDIMTFNVSYQGSIRGVSVIPDDHGVQWSVANLSSSQVQLLINTTNTSKAGKQLNVTLYSNMSHLDCGITNPELLHFQSTLTVCTPPKFEIIEITRDTSEEFLDIMTFNVSYQGIISGVSVIPDYHGVQWSLAPLSSGQVQLLINITNTSKAGQQLNLTLYSDLSHLDCGITDPDLLHFQSTFTVCTPPAKAIVKLESLPGSGIRVESVEANDGAFDRIDISSDPPLPDAYQYINLTTTDLPLTIFNFEPGIRYQLFFDLFLGAFKETECGKGLPAYPSVSTRTTETVCFAPHQPELSFVDVTTSSFTINLNNTRSLDESNEYQVKITGPGGIATLSPFIGGFRDYVVEGLKSDTRYTVEVTLSYRDDGCSATGGIVSSRSTASIKTKFSGTPTEISCYFISASICNLNWDHSNTFVATEEPSESYYEVFLNGKNLLFQLPANTTKYSKVIEDLEVCSSYSVLIVPVKNDEIGDSAKFVLRDWTNLDSAIETMRDFPQSIDQCGVCPNAELSDICRFPFEYRDQNYTTCTTKHPDDLEFDENSTTLFCKRASGSMMECNSASKKCLPEMPAFGGNWSFETVAYEEVSISWSVSSDLYSFFNLYLNNNFFEATRNKNVLLQNLTIGQSYTFEVELNSYGRLSPRKPVNFLHSNLSRNAFAYEPTTISVELAWDDLGQNLKPTEETTISEIQVLLVPEVSWVTQALFAEEERKNLEKTVTFPSGNSGSVANLTSGLNYTVNITGLDDESNIVKKTSVQTNAPTVPNRITKEENNLTVTFDEVSGISVVFNISRNTIADYFIVEVFEITSEAALKEIDDVLVVVGYNVNRNAIDLSCQAVNQSCLDNSSLGYERNTFKTGLKPGAKYSASVKGQTASNFGETSTTQQTLPPNPVTSLMVVESLETSIQLSWQLPRGSFLGFIVEYITHDGTLESKLTYGRSAILSGLIPGFNYSFNVSAMADSDVRSQPQTVFQETRPAKPEKVSTEQLSKKSFVIFIQKPSRGFWSFLEISSVDDLSNSWPSNKEGLLMNQTTPILFDPETFSAVIHIAKSGTVISVRVRARSASDLESRSTKAFTITGLEPIERKPEILINDEITVCIVWNYPNENVFYNQVEGKISSYQTVSYNTHKQQDVGLMCFEKNQLDDNNFTVVMEFATIDRINNLETFSGPKNFNFEVHGTQLINILLEASCEGVFCTVEIKMDFVPNYSKFEFRYQLFETNGETFFFIDVVSLSICTIESQLICSIQLDELRETQSYGIAVSLALFDRIAPVNASGTFTTGSPLSSAANNSTVVIVVSFMIAVVVLSAVTAAIVFTVKKRSKPTERELFDEYIADPTIMPTYGVGSQTPSYHPPNQTEYINPEEDNEHFESSFCCNGPGDVNMRDNDIDVPPYLRPASSSVSDE